MIQDYELAIHPAADKEWAKLDGGIKRRFKEKLAKERLFLINQPA